MRQTWPVVDKTTAVLLNNGMGFRTPPGYTTRGLPHPTHFFICGPCQARLEITYGSEDVLLQAMPCEEVLKRVCCFLCNRAASDVPDILRL